MSDKYALKPEHKFTFGLWTVGNIGRDPFGSPVRDTKSPLELVVLAASSSILVFEAKCIKLRLTSLSRHDFIVPNQEVGLGLEMIDSMASISGIPDNPSDFSVSSHAVSPFDSVLFL